MASDYIQVNLSEIIEVIGEDDTKKILSTFSCPMNLDVQEFLKEKAIEFSKRYFAKTHLILWQSEDEKEIELIGYFAIAQKSFTISKTSVSKSCYKQISQFGTFDEKINARVVPALLIGQLGKNYANGNDTLISGDELLKLALDKVKDIQKECGGRYTYLECEDNEKLIDFYKRNGFVSFGRRKLDNDETNINGRYLIQFLKKIK